MAAHQQELWQEVQRLLVIHPDAKIVTDVGASICSGWGTLESVELHQLDGKYFIELKFD